MPTETREAPTKRPKELIHARIKPHLYDAVMADIARSKPKVTITAWLTDAVEEYLLKRGALPCKK